MIDQGKVVETAVDGMATATKGMHDLTTEMMRLSMDSLKATTQTFEQLRSARSFEDILKIQADYFRDSFARFSDYGQRIASMTSTMPGELAKQTGAIAQKAGADVVSAAKQASDDAMAATVGVELGLPNDPGADR